MASISIMITDNVNGVMNSSFSLGDNEVKRIYEALKEVYRPQLEEQPTQNTNGETVYSEYNPSPKDVFNLLSSSLVQHILNNCYETEVELKVAEFKKAITPITLKAQ